MAKIFINYRRADSITAAFIIYNYLTARKHDVFIDKEAIPVGFDFAAFIKKKIRTYDVMLTLIGNQWLSIRDDNKKIRIKNTGDHVRLELAEALKTGSIKIIPVLIDKVQMPGEQSLPGDLRPMVKLNAVDFFSYEYEKSAERILKEIERSLQLLRSKDLSPYIKMMSIKDDRGVVYSLKASMEVNLLADKKIHGKIDFNKLDENVLYVSKLKKGEGTYILSALYAAEQFGVVFTAWRRQKDATEETTATPPDRGLLKRYTVGSIDEMIVQLNANRPVMAIAKIHDNTWTNKDVTKNGLLLLPPFNDRMIGQHAIIITNVDLVKNRIKFAMLWGSNWGDRGFGYFSEESFFWYVDKEQLYAIETVI